MPTNLILTSGGLGYVLDSIAAERRDTAPQTPQFIVVSSGIATIGMYHTTVPGETFRASITDRTRSGLQVIYSAFLGPADNPNQVVRLYGIVAGNNASQQADTGTLIAIGEEPTPFTKDGTNAVGIDLAITISGISS